MVLALLYFINSILSYLMIDTEFISYIQFILFVTFIYISSYSFRFCNYHRVFIHYIVFETIVNYVDYNYGIPFEFKSMIVLQTIIALIFLFIILYLKQHDKLPCKENDSKSLT